MNHIIQLLLKIQYIHIDLPAAILQNINLSITSSSNALPIKNNNDGQGRNYLNVAWSDRDEMLEGVEAQIAVYPLTLRAGEAVGFNVMKMSLLHEI